MATIKEVEDLPGIGKATVEKLKLAGFDSLLAIATSRVEEISAIEGISDATAKQIIALSQEARGVGEFTTGEELFKREEKAEYITTGSAEFDKILHGGIRTGEVTEAFGEFGSSKSQLAFQLCVNIQLPKEQKGLNKKAIFIDTENTFSAGRVEQIAKGTGLDPAKVLKNIRVAKAFNSEHQILLLNKAIELIKQDKTIGLLVIDSLTSHFRSDFVGRGELAERQQKLNKYLHAISRASDVYGVAVYFTNQVMSRPDVFFGDPTEAVGGHVLKHAAQTRIYLRKGKKGSRVARIVDSPSLPDCEAAFIVKEEGIRDVKDVK